MTESLEYELIDISFSFDYDYEREETPYWLVHDDTKITADEPKEAIQYDADGIPMGKSMEEIRMRELIISQFLHQWSENNPDRRVFNTHLNDYIYIKGKSIGELMQHSSKRYLSTCAVLHFEKLLAQAKPVGDVQTKLGNKKQEEFDHMLVMSSVHPVYGTVKITVGVKKSNAQHVQYGMTALHESEPIIDPNRQGKQKDGKNKKAHR